MSKYNTWTFAPYGDWHLTAEFGPDDFERWWLAGMDRDDPITDQHEMFDAMVDLAEAEGREIVQTATELRAAIANWTQIWNSHTTDYTRDDDGRCVRVRSE